MKSPAERGLIFECRGERLVGILHPAARTDPSRPGVLVIVGGPQYRVGSHRQFVLMARALAAEGYPTFRFDYRGMGDSEGAVRTFDTVDDDIKAAIDAWFADDPDLPGVVLWGLCDGASAAMIYCPKDDRVVAVAAVNPWVRTEAAAARSYLRHYYWRRLLQRSFWTKVVTLRLDIRATILDLTKRVALSRHEPSSADPAGAGFIQGMLMGIGRFRGPLLLQLSGRDLTAQQFADRLEQDPPWQRVASRNLTAIVRHPDADHTFSERKSLDRACESLLAWLSTLRPSAQGTHRSG